MQSSLHAVEEERALLGTSYSRFSLATVGSIDTKNDARPEDSHRIMTSFVPGPRKPRLRDE